MAGLKEGPFEVFFVFEFVQVVAGCAGAMFVFGRKLRRIDELEAGFYFEAAGAADDDQPFYTGWTNPRIYEDFMEASHAIQEGVKKAGVKRLIVIGGAGSLEIKPGLQLIDTPQFPAEYKHGASAARDYLNELKNEKDLEWTFFSPAIFMNHENSGERKGHYRLGLDNPVFDDKGQSVLSVEDLALVIVDELEHPRHIRQRFTAGY